MDVFILPAIGDLFDSSSLHSSGAELQYWISASWRIGNDIPFFILLEVSETKLSSNFPLNFWLPSPSLPRRNAMKTGLVTYNFLLES